jgi:hypothetical protein
MACVQYFGCLTADDFYDYVVIGSPLNRLTNVPLKLPLNCEVRVPVGTYSVVDKARNKELMTFVVTRDGSERVLITDDVLGSGVSLTLRAGGIVPWGCVVTMKPMAPAEKGSIQFSPLCPENYRCLLKPGEYEVSVATGSRKWQNQLLIVKQGKQDIHLNLVP